MTRTAPTLDIDIFSQEVQGEPWDVYRRLRDEAPVVHVEHELYEAHVVSRYEDVKRVLSDWHTFTSSQGVAFNDLMNERSRQMVLGCDPPDHSKRRSVIQQRLKLGEVRAVTPEIRAKADAIVAEVVAAAEFDAIQDLARPFVERAVGGLLGMPAHIVRRFGEEGHHFFTMSGPPNELFEAAAPVVAELLSVLQDVEKSDVEPGGLAWTLFEAAERGEVPPEMCAMLMYNALGGSTLGTTISSIGSSIQLLASHPEQWELLRSDPGLAQRVFTEAIRLETPIQIWSRVCRDGAEIDGIDVPKGARVAVLIGSANRDERHFPDPDTFDIMREPNDVLSFGWGVHRCVGASLATAEVTSVLAAFAEQVSAVEITGSSTRRVNNTLRGLSSLPVRVVPGGNHG